MGEKLFYQRAPYIFILAGIVFCAIGFTLDRYLQSLGYDPGWIIWPVITALMSFIGFTLGGLLQKLEVLATIDQLTGLSNRRHFYSILEYELKRQHRMQSTLCLAMIDVDDFKSVNDRFGHQAGDRVLRELAEICRSNVRLMDTIGRWGGDEFAVLFPETAGDRALQAAERVKKAVAEARTLLCGSTISIGVISVSANMGLDGILAFADAAMYEAKKVKNTVFLQEQDSCVPPE
ncbi:MAG: GGDEF domain-containing protein [Negativicutes bacterium]|nr:GGDEF domain-containing protein [Negativicutes bacterium]